MNLKIILNCSSRSCLVIGWFTLLWSTSPLHQLYFRSCSLSQPVASKFCHQCNGLFIQRWPWVTESNSLDKLWPRVSQVFQGYPKLSCGEPLVHRGLKVSRTLRRWTPYINNHWIFCCFHIDCIIAFIFYYFSFSCHYSISLHACDLIEIKFCLLPVFLIWIIVRYVPAYLVYQFCLFLV